MLCIVPILVFISCNLHVGDGTPVDIVDSNLSSDVATRRDTETEMLKRCNARDPDWTVSYELRADSILEREKYSTS